MVSIKQSDVNAMKQEATKKGCELAFNLMLAIPALEKQPMKKNFGKG